jgi:hypothetical protein
MLPLWLLAVYRASDLIGFVPFHRGLYIASDSGIGQPRMGWVYWNRGRARLNTERRSSHAQTRLGSIQVVHRQRVRRSLLLSNAPKVS